VTTPCPEPDPAPASAFNVAPQLSMPLTTTKAGSQGIRQTIVTGTTDPSLNISVAGTDPDPAAAVRSPTLPASTIPREAVPDPSPAGGPPDMSATD
jgi:hypothetical protein